MDKALEFLEKHCQWLAVGLGGLFLGWMAWSYGLMAPVSVPDGQANTVEPGNVDETIAKRFAEDLKTQIDRKDVPPAPADKALILQSGDIGAMPAPTLTSLASLAFDSQPAQVQKLQEDKNTDKLVKVTELPAVPPATIVESLSKRATIDPAVQNVAGAPPQPPMAPPVAGPGGVPAGPKLADINYVRVSYTVNPAEIDKAFTAVKVPANLTTSVLAVQLMRQEQKPDGTWTDAVAVPAAKVSMQTWPAPAAAAAGPAGIAQFRAWAEATEGQTAILRPAFYTITLGEGPWDPSMDDALPKFDPKAAAAERERLRKEAEDKRKAANPPRTTTPPRSTGRGARGGGGARNDNNDALDPARPADLGAIVGAMPTQAAPPTGDVTGDPTTPTPPPVVVAPGQGQPPVEKPLPTAAAFSPNGVPEFLGWAYDETVVEGHTYRYQVTYSLRNPIYDTNLGNPVALGQQFAIVGKIDENAWGQPVEVKPSAEYYLNTNNWQSVTNIPVNIKIDVYKWSLGKWQAETFQVSPGDKIGGVKAGVDFNTNATVVDLRYDTRGISESSKLPGRSFVLLLTADGRLVEREPTSDRANNRMLSLKQEVERIKSTVQPATPGAPTAPGMGDPGGG